MAAADVLPPPVPFKLTFPPPVVGPTTKKPTIPTKQIPLSLIEAARNVEKQDFDPVRHLNYVPPEKIITMAEIGLEGAGISPTAVSEPFSLFTEEAIKQIRAEIFSEGVLSKCQFASSFASNMIRGYDETLAPFTFKAWYSPEVAKAVSEVAGMEMVPVFPYEVGHCNVYVNDKMPTEAELASMQTSSGDDVAAFSWHRDSYPFVCVTMLSDCTDMVGGETMMRTGDGKTMKVRGPRMGTAVVLQGRYIEHQALKAFTAGERISMITAWRPKSAMVKDEIVLTTIRPISYQNELYPQYSEYRLETLIARFQWQLQQIQERAKEKGKFDLEGVRNFLAEQGDYINQTLTEMVDYDN